MNSYYPNINTQLDEGAFMPDRAHSTDAGADLFSTEDFILHPMSSHFVETGVHIELPENTKAEIVPKSGLNRDHNILAFGLIDQGYSGSIGVTLYNFGTEPYHFRVGDKITQVVVSPVCYPTYTQVDEIKAGPRGSNGFGSTDRNGITGGPRP